MTFPRSTAVMRRSAARGGGGWGGEGHGARRGRPSAALRGALISRGVTPAGRRDAVMRAARYAPPPRPADLYTHAVSAVPACDGAAPPLPAVMGAGGAFVGSVCGVLAVGGTHAQFLRYAADGCWEFLSFR